MAQEVKVCDHCGKPLADLGHSNDSEQLEIETTVYRRVVRRKRYRQTCDCAGRPRTVTAPLPPKLLPKSIYGTSLWIHLLLEKSSSPLLMPSYVSTPARWPSSAIANLRAKNFVSPVAKRSSV